MPLPTLCRDVLFYLDAAALNANPKASIAKLSAKAHAARAIADLTVARAARAARFNARVAAVRDTES
ncbi:hypothetical protein N7447_003946 [Penicillium robsamsonii]|uniref:uncharacterized protein n=1 Tax=Penicillium robsamsonii TaxID=1792511 RepID=UPI0025467C9E|nr:uncharacterized protein N7447_003946 [Penicillium robsamsonii]KAJ5827183.1 hypothetical protein N7447_003946 [Penicillium robsamsonii]